MCGEALLGRYIRNDDDDDAAEEEEGESIVAIITNMNSIKRERELNSN